jgi:thioredoxin-like negative regulator of GroEL
MNQKRWRELRVLDKPVEVTDATFRSLEEHLLAVLDFWHPLCRPCQELALLIDRRNTLVNAPSRS